MFAHNLKNEPKVIKKKEGKKYVLTALTIVMTMAMMTMEILHITGVIINIFMRSLL